MAKDFFLTFLVITEPAPIIESLSSFTGATNEELEPTNRSFYGGAIGYFDSNGDMDTCISLRSGLVKNGKLHIQAGGGVVYDSNPEDEYQETINKAGALMAAAEDSYKYN